jgi:hypothetical protein
LLWPAVRCVAEAAGYKRGGECCAPMYRSDRQRHRVHAPPQRTSQSVPTTMSVLDSSALEGNRVYRVQDLQQLLPSTTVNYVHARQMSFAVRGSATIRPAMDSKAVSACISITSTWPVPAWPRSMRWTSSSWNCCVARRARCSARTPRPAC